MPGLIPAHNERFAYRVLFNHLHAGDLVGEVSLDGGTIVVSSHMSTTRLISKLYTLTNTVRSSYARDDGNFLGSIVAINEKGRVKNRQIHHDRARGVIVENGIDYEAPEGPISDIAGLVVSVRDASIIGRRVTLYENRKFFPIEFTKGEQRSFFKKKADPSVLVVKPIVHGLDRGHIEFYIDHAKARMPYRIELGLKFAALTLELSEHSIT